MKNYWTIMLLIGSFLIVGCNQSIVTAKESSKAKKFEDLKPFRKEIGAFVLHWRWIFLLTKKFM